MVEPATENAAKSRAKHAFTAIASTYDQGGPAYFSRFGERLVEYAGVASGDRVLDVATGRGALLFPAARAAGDRGSVLGIDLSETMIDATRAETERRGLANIELRVMDAEHLDCADASFDVVLCGFALMFFPSLDHAVSGLRRVLRPSGVLAVSTFASNIGQLIDPVMQAYQGSAFRPLVQSLGTPDELQAVLDRAGLTNVEVQSETLDIVYPDVDSVWTWHMGLLTGVWVRAQPPEIQQRFEADVRAHLSSISQADGIHESITALFGKGTR